MKPEAMAIVQDLSRYLRSHPEACDTAEGIARWWVAGDAGAPLPAVELALDWMVRRGLVASAQAADGRVRFRRAGGAELDLLLDRVAADPQAVIRAIQQAPPSRGVH